MTIEDIHSKIEELARKVFEDAQMELIELRFGGHKNDVQIQITADKASGSITIRECAILNKSLVAAIERDNVLPPENFSLELSSPGLDRPLITRKDFLRVIGQEIHFWLNEAVGGKKEAEGILTEVGESALTILVSNKTQLALPLSSIIKGLLVI